MIYHLANCDNSGFLVVTVIHHALLCVVAIRAIRLEKDFAVFFDPLNVNQSNQLISIHGDTKVHKSIDKNPRRNKGRCRNLL